MSGLSCLSHARALSRARPLHRRCFSNATTKQTDPKQIAESFLSKFGAGQTFTRKQFLDANQLRLFSLTLDRPYLWPNGTNLSESEPKAGTPIPAGYHTAYFTPAQLPGILGIDGTDASFNPEAPFTRRMWAGGTVYWPGADPGASTKALLRVGEEATETTKVLSCEAKTIKKTGESMLVVGVEKEFRNAQGDLAILDKRNWVFRKALDPNKSAKIVEKPKLLEQDEIEEQNKGHVVRKYVRDEVQLFRLSALTFNAHRIHYDLPWARNVEGHRGIVVHGPLNWLAMLDLWRDQKGGEVWPKETSYRATSPVYAGEAYRVLLPEGTGTEGVGKEVEARVISDDGSACMKGTIVDW